ncbi:MAG TPA: phage head closure protein [Tepidisphaeraceae bacterium]|jgi:SPP1 family predicted phage head-tail adaptor|nr:phage head closure protein [Tepidisphaeraceae bacterium]
MNAGSLRHTLTLQRPVSVTDAYGETTATSWVDVMPIRAALKPTRSAENLRARLKGLETSFELTMRYSAEVTSERRFLWEGKELYIDGIIDVDGRHREMRVTTFSRVEVPGG